MIEPEMKGQVGEEAIDTPITQRGSACHPLADLFPLMEGKPFDELCESIERDGLVQPIVRQEGLIVDGRNRQRACDKIGCAAHYVQFSDLGLHCSVEEYIWNQNVVRRHLTDDQRATIAMQWKPQMEAAAKEAMVEGGKTAGRGRPQQGLAKTPKPKKSPGTRKKLAEQAHVSEHKIRQAEEVAKKAPELLAYVKSGSLPLRKATKQAKAKAVQMKADAQPAREAAIPEKPKGKRQQVIEGEWKRRMSFTISGLPGIATALSGMTRNRIPILRAACTLEERRRWASQVLKAVKALRAFAAALNPEGKACASEESED